MQYTNSYKQFLINEYKILKEFKSKYTLKVLIKEALENLNYSSIKDNEVIIHNIASLFERDKDSNQMLEYIFLYKNTSLGNIEEKREKYLSYIIETLKNIIIYSENQTEVKLSFKSVSFDNKEKQYIKSQLFRYINILGNNTEGLQSILLSKEDYIYNKKSKETIIKDLEMNISLKEENNQKIINSSSYIKEDIYNSNNRMVESSKRNRINKFYKYEIENLDDIIPSEEDYLDLQILRDNGSCALFINQKENSIIEKEIPLIYDIDEINYYVGNKFYYGNPTLRNIYHKYENKPLQLQGVTQLKVEEMLLNNMLSYDDIILNNDEDLFSRIYKFSSKDMIDLTKTITKEEQANKKLVKNML